MKTIMTLSLLFYVEILFANEKYEKAMQSNIDALYQAQTTETLQQAVNTFERIGNAENDKWEPYYYATFGYIMMATREQEGAKKDAFLDKADEVLKKASSINPSESEMVTLQGFIYTIRVTVDPASRGQQYSGLAMQTLGKALSMNPENPRALSLMAQMQYGTAQFFKSSTEEACATGRKAVEKFESYKNDNVLAPLWGKESALAFVKRCN